MKALMTMAMAAHRLEMMARPMMVRQDDVAVMQKALLEIASDLTAAAENAATSWGELTAAIRDLEKGK